MWRIIFQLAYFNDDQCSQPVAGLPEFHGALAIEQSASILHNESSMLVFPAQCDTASDEHSADTFLLYALQPPVVMSQLSPVAHIHAGSGYVTVENDTCHTVPSTMFWPGISHSSTPQHNHSFKITTCNTHYCDGSMSSTLLATSQSSVAVTSTNPSSSLSGPTSAPSPPQTVHTTESHAYRCQTITNADGAAEIQCNGTENDTTAVALHLQTVRTRTENNNPESTESHTYRCRTINNADGTTEVECDENHDDAAAAAFFFLFITIVVLGLCTMGVYFISLYRE